MKDLLKNKKAEELKRKEIKNMNDLFEIVELCRGGFKHNQIIIESTLVDGDKTVVYANEKGVYITRIREMYVKENNIIGERFRELWLTQKGRFIVFDTISKREEDSDYPFEIKRKIADNQDISQYNMNNILSGIKRSLERKMKSLQNRVDSQQDKIDKISDMLNK